MKNPQNNGTWLRLGRNVWGTATAALGFGLVAVILTGYPDDVAARIESGATALGAVVAASALAWAHFFQADGRHEEVRRLEKMARQIDRLMKRFDEDEGDDKQGADYE